MRPQQRCPLPIPAVSNCTYGLGCFLAKLVLSPTYAAASPTVGCNTVPIPTSSSLVTGMDVLRLVRRELGVAIVV
eukprot:365445-Chlamydomonas_euryale.AAC.17